MTKTLVSLRGKKGANLFVTSVWFAPGDGFKVEKFSYSPARDRAAQFSRAAAEAIGQQLCTGYAVTLWRPDGSTERVTMTPTQQQQRADAQRLRDELNRDVSEMLTEALNILRRTP